MSDFTQPINIQPEQQVYELLLTARTAVSHHDAAVQDDSNETLYNRERRVFQRQGYVQQQVSQDAVTRLAAEHPVPPDVADCLIGLGFPFFVGCAMTRVFLDEYNVRNAGEGEGIFTGAERYERLGARLRHAAIRAHTLSHCWDVLCEQLRCPMHSARDTTALLTRLWGLPGGLQELVLRALSDHTRSIVTIAQLWHTQLKLRNPDYAKHAKTTQLTDSLQLLAFDAAQIVPGSETEVVADVPSAVSANSLRHQIVRYPGMLHLYRRLGLVPGIPGQGPVPAGVEALFENGGNILEGQKEPPGAFLLTQLLRQLYPLVDLLSGNANAFNLGGSRLACHSILVCRENEEALEGTTAEGRPLTAISAYDLLDNITFTRHAGRSGLHQMIVNQEALVPGAEMLFRMVLEPYSPTLTHGALEAALKTWAETLPVAGGQKARGFGWLKHEWLSRPNGTGEPLRLYEAHVDENREKLAQGLVDGTMGTGSVLIS